MLENTITLNRRTLYILSGAPGSGKSTFLKGVDKEMIISTDKIRKSLIQKKKKLSKNEVVKDYISDQADLTTFEIVNLMLETKMREKLTTFIDATNISDEERGRYIKIAQKWGMPYEVLIMDTSLEKCLINDEYRNASVGEEIVISFYERFQLTSQYPYRVVNMRDNIEFNDQFIIPNDIKLDVIGDVHGLYDELIELIESVGYHLENGIPVHNDTSRRLLFLGDFVDRGTQSLQVLKFVKRCVEDGHYAIIGNHENKLIKNLLTKQEPKGSFAVLSTFIDIQKLSKNEIDELLIFLKSLNGYYIQGSCIFTHANISHFTPETPLAEFMYGTYPKKEKDTDKEYQKLFDKGINQYTMIRGHVKQKTIQENVYSLEYGQAYAGHLALLKTYECKKFTYKELKEKTVLHKVHFNFDTYLIEKNLIYRVDNLLAQKLITVKTEGLLKMVKYSGNVFYKNLWNQGGDLLLKSRGLVIDLAGNIIQHSFDKVFNYRENNAGLDIPDNEVIQYIEKKNGFLGNITLNPFTKELLITTTGSFDSQFTEYVKSFIDGKTKYLLKNFLSKNDVTLSFEVVHVEDPHIIEEEEGLYLIGIRGKNYNDKGWQEDKIDEVAAELGFKRSTHGFTTFGLLRDNIIPECKHEGYMVRRLNGDTYDLALKFKSPFYLTTKFIGRLNAGNAKFMFKSPEKFKEKLDEEFFPIVDQIVSNLTLEKFTSMSRSDSVAFVRELIIKYQSGN